MWTVGARAPCGLATRSERDSGCFSCSVAPFETCFLTDLVACSAYAAEYGDLIARLQLSQIVLWKRPPTPATDIGLIAWLQRGHFVLCGPSPTELQLTLTSLPGCNARINGQADSSKALAGA